MYLHYGTISPVFQDRWATEKGRVVVRKLKWVNIALGAKAIEIAVALNQARPRSTHLRILWATCFPSGLYICALSLHSE